MSNKRSNKTKSKKKMKKRYKLMTSCNSQIMMHKRCLKLVFKKILKAKLKMIMKRWKRNPRNKLSKIKNKKKIGSQMSKHNHNQNSCKYKVKRN